jgi:predicted protein tyrosine phosphatase
MVCNRLSLVLVEQLSNGNSGGKTMTLKMKPRILFVCGKNQWRSPTAVAIYKSDQRIEVRSAGVSSKSKKRISTADIEWADLILVMEKEYKSRIIEKFSEKI